MTKKAKTKRRKGGKAKRRTARSKGATNQTRQQHLKRLAPRLGAAAVAVGVYQSDTELGLGLLAISGLLLIHAVHLWVMDRIKPSAQQLQQLLLGGGILCIFGLGIVGTRPSDWGGAVVLTGWLSLMYGIHCYGRLGSDGTQPPWASSNEKAN